MGNCQIHFGPPLKGGVEIEESKTSYFRLTLAKLGTRWFSVPFLTNRNALLKVLQIGKNLLGITHKKGRKKIEKRLDFIQGVFVNLSE